MKLTWYREGKDHITTRGELPLVGTKIYLYDATNDNIGKCDSVRYIVNDAYIKITLGKCLISLFVDKIDSSIIGAGERFDAICKLIEYETDSTITGISPDKKFMEWARQEGEVTIEEAG